LTGRRHCVKNKIALAIILLTEPLIFPFYFEKHEAHTIIEHLKQKPNGSEYDNFKSICSGDLDSLLEDIKTLDLSNHNLETVEYDKWQELGCKLSHCQQLINLDLSGNQIFKFSNDQLFNAGGAIGLWLSYLNPASLAIKKFPFAESATLYKYCPLTHLNLGFNGLFERCTTGWAEVKILFQRCHELKSLSLDGNRLRKLNTEDWLALGDALSPCRNLTHLSLRFNSLNLAETETWAAIGDALAKLENLTNLNLSGNELLLIEDNDWLKLLIKKTYYCKKLRTIDFDDLEVTNERKNILSEHGFSRSTDHGTWSLSHLKLLRKQPLSLFKQIKLK
jgi:Leucine-rich repeat (LRR) protein